MGDIKHWFKEIKKDCPRCNGKGKVICDCNDGWTKCNICNGSGTRTITKTVTGKTDVGSCQTCDGKGVVHCSSCGGYGEILDEEGRGRACLQCRGSRIENCRICNGSGRDIRNVSESVTSPAPCNCTDGEVRCDKCGLDGTRKCPRCKGKGRIFRIEKVIVIVAILGVVLYFLEELLNMIVPILILFVAYKLVKKYVLDKEENRDVDVYMDEDEE